MFATKRGQGACTGNKLYSNKDASDSDFSATVCINYHPNLIVQINITIYVDCFWSEKVNYLREEKGRKFSFTSV